MPQQPQGISLQTLEKNISRSITQISASVQTLIDALESFGAENAKIKEELQTLKKDQQDKG
jgi:hypothetical protein